MANQSPPGFDVEYLRSQVRATYDAVARSPEGDYHFHRGPDYAARYLAYDPDELAALPARATARFAGVGNPLAMTRDPAVGPVEPGQVVLDHACGGGTDLLLAARRVAPTGRAIGVDMTQAMRERSQRRLRRKRGLATSSASARHVRGVAGRRCERRRRALQRRRQPRPDKPQVFREIVRVLKPGGRLLLADVIVQRELTLDARADREIWAACIGGALVESEFYELARDAGLAGGRITRRFNCFQGTSAEEHVAKDLFPHGVNFYACKAA